MKVSLKLFIAVAITGIISCNGNSAEMQERITELELKVTELESAKTGLGSIMNQIQVYHAKFFFAMQNDNRELMQYVHHELEENFEEVVENHGEHDGINISELADNTILPALKELEDKLNDDQDSTLFQSFENLTLACNKCHMASNHSFIRIKNPEGETYLNQAFSQP